MNITSVRVFPVEQKGPTRAYATVTFDDALVIRDIRIVEGKNGLFISMPSRRKKDGEFQDICYPITSEMRTTIQQAILAKYSEEAS